MSSASERRRNGFAGHIASGVGARKGRRVKGVTTDAAPEPTWRIASDLPGRIRFRYPVLRRDDDLARRIEAELASAHGVHAWHLRPLTGSLLVHYDSRAITTAQLRHLLDRAAARPAVPAELGRHPSPVKFGLANGSVALAAAGELAIPALLPASAVLLVASNLRVIRQAWRELSRRQIGLPTLFTTIIVGTLGTGQFLAASLMAWMLAFWRYRHRVAQFRLRRQLLRPLTQRRHFARLLVNTQEVEVPTDRLAEGDRIVVDEGELIPVDGVLLASPALVDEALIRGVPGLSWKQPGDLVYAGSISVQGGLQVSVRAHGDATRAAQLGREVAGAAAFSPTGLAVTSHGEEFGRRAVAPTLAAAGIGLIVGDVTTAATILRPDYSTGPGLGVSLESLRDIAACAQEGVVIRDATGFGRIASADLFLFDDLPFLAQSDLKIASVEGSDGSDEADVLRLAATAFRGLADDRAQAMQSACEANRIELPDVRPSYRGPGITFTDGVRSICVHNAQVQDGSSTAAPLQVVVDGRTAGVVHFGPSAASRAAKAIEDLRNQGAVAVGLISDRPAALVEQLASALGVDLRAGGLSSRAKVEFLRSLRARGCKVAYVGDCAKEPTVAKEAHVAISIVAETGQEPDCAQVRVLRAGLAWLGPLRELSRAHVDRVRTVHGAILLPNLVCIAGAFFLGLTSLSAVVLTNLGTLAVYSGLPRRTRKARSLVPPPSPASKIT